MPLIQTFRKLRNRLGIAAWKVDPIGLEIGSSFLQFCDDQVEGNLISRITEMRKQLDVEMDTVLPTVRVRDNFGLPETGYVICVWDQEVARGSASSAELIVSHLRAIIQSHKEDLRS